MKEEMFVRHNAKMPLLDAHGSTGQTSILISHALKTIRRDEELWSDTVSQPTLLPHTELQHHLSPLYTSCIMQLIASFVALTSLAVSAVSAAPFSSLLATRALESFQPEGQIDSVWRIHESCNGTQRAQISSGIDDMKKLAHNSINHILNYPKDEFFIKYFGQDADPAPVVGYYVELVYVSVGDSRSVHVVDDDFMLTIDLLVCIQGNKGDALLRCDNPDDNCRLPEWNGHWRGNNATAETVICELSYVTRRPLEKLCSAGFQLGTDNPSLYFGADLMHRAFHVPEFVHEKIHHYADSYADVLELAEHNSTAAVQNQHSLQYFALDVYSRKLTKWGCIGDVKQSHDDHAHASSSSVAPAPTSTPAATPTPSAASSDCHTHADGSIHCGTH